ECHHHCASIVCGPCKPRSPTSTETFAIHESPIVCRMGCFERRSMSRFGFPRRNEASPSRQFAFPPGRYLSHCGSWDIEDGWYQWNPVDPRHKVEDDSNERECEQPTFG